MKKLAFIFTLLLILGSVTACSRNSAEAPASPSVPAKAQPQATAPQQPAPQTVEAAAPAPDPQPATPQSRPGGDTSVLRPPKGASLAIIVFEDLQCPDCSRAEPILKEAEKTYKIPLVRYDFPLPMHNWSFDAHVIARYFDSKSLALGEEFRHWVFMNQASINKTNLQNMAQRFAEQHKTELPLFVDPTGQFAAKVKADFQLGQRVGIEHTPTIYIVSNTHRGTPFVEVTDRSQMFQMIDDMKKKVE